MAPAIDVALAAAGIVRELGGGGAGLTGSPPRSARVLRFNILNAGGGIDAETERALLAEADISPSLAGEVMRLG